jgi:prevent-host-death family protein
MLARTRKESDMVKTISATQAKNQFGALVESIKDGEGDVIVVNRGEPAVAIIPVSRYEDLARFDRDERHRQAAATLRRLRAEIQVQNPDMTEELANEISNRAANDIALAIKRRLTSQAGDER